MGIPAAAAACPTSAACSAGSGQRRHLYLVNHAAFEHTGQAIDMIGMEVGEHNECHLADSQVIEAAVDLARLGAGVDHDD
ncbi:MAG: hypothetical protein WKF73_06315 [Nocardioidaceae bacterium]